MIDKIVAGMCVEQKIIQASWPQPDSRVVPPKKMVGCAIVFPMQTLASKLAD